MKKNSEIWKKGPITISPFKLLESLMVRFNKRILLNINYVLHLIKLFWALGFFPILYIQIVP